MKHNKKTNAARILDDMNIAYRIIEYEVDEEHLDAVHVANSVGMPAERCSRPWSFVAIRRG